MTPRPSRAPDHPAQRAPPASTVPAVPDHPRSIDRPRRDRDRCRERHGPGDRDACSPPTACTSPLSTWSTRDCRTPRPPSPTRAAGGRSVCDMADGGAIVDAVAGVRAELGPTDIVVNCAGVSIVADIGNDAYEAAWEATMAVNLTAYVRSRSCDGGRSRPRRPGSHRQHRVDRRARRHGVHLARTRRASTASSA